MCVKDKLKNTPLWLRFTVASMTTIGITLGTALWAIAARDTNITRDIANVDSKVEANAKRLIDQAGRQETRMDDLYDSHKNDHDKLIEYGTNQGHILRTLIEIRSMIKDNH